MHIYIRQNKTSFKKYIGYQTTSPSSNYLGGGSYWINHNKSNGGHNKNNINTLMIEEFQTKEAALLFLNEFEKQNPKYWLTDNWCNMVQETLEVSALKGNMEIIFEKHGNPFSGGEIQRKSWDDPNKRISYNASDTVKKGWLKRNKKEAVEKMLSGHKQFRKNNPEAFNLICAAGANASKLKNCVRIKYNEKIYIGWAEFARETGISKYIANTKYKDDILIIQPNI